MKISIIRSLVKKMVEVQQQEGMVAVTQTQKEITTAYQPSADKTARWMYDYDRLYWELKAKLYGGWLTEDKKGFYVIRCPKNSEPFMNEQGIEKTMAIVNGFISKIQALSIISEERILELDLELNFALVAFYYENMEEFNMSRATASVVIRMIMSMVEANWRKSINGNGLRWASGSERVLETVNQAQPQPGLLRRLLP